MSTENRWEAEAACRSNDPEIFFPRSGSASAATQAKKVCRGCPVRAQCLQWALETEQPFGVWGGLSESERLEQWADRQPGLTRAERLAAEPEQMLKLLAGGYSVFSVAILLGTSVVTINRARRLLDERATAGATAGAL